MLEQTIQIPETKRQSVRSVQIKSKGKSNGNSNWTKNVNPEIRSETTGVSGPQVNDTARTWSRMIGKATVNSENWTTVPRSKKTNNNNKNNNSNADKFDTTDYFKAIKYRRLIITPKAQIGDIDSLLLRNQINSLFKYEKLTIVVNTVEKSKTGQNIVLTTSPDNTAEDLLDNKSI